MAPVVPHAAAATVRTTVQCFRMAKNPPPAPDQPAAPTGEIVLYRTEDGRTRVECRFVDETLWLSQALIAELFQKDVRTVNEHLQNIYEEGEIEAQATIRKFRIVRRDGSREVEREIEHYNLDAILAVGYRVRTLLLPHSGHIAMPPSSQAGRG